jgi:hypothetical protein
MDPGYQAVMDPTTIVWGALAAVLHLGVMITQVGLAVFLVLAGMRRLAADEGRWAGALLGGFGVLLVAPVAGAPSLVSLFACLGAIAILLALDRSPPNGGLDRWKHAAVFGCAGVTALFMVWEREDPLALGVELASTAQAWRTHERDWQLANDLEAPKVGELAPDFELQDPSGRNAVRLADFRGKWAVVLIFGSHT